MNKLSYGLLSLIAVTPCTGYELTQRIQLFWSAKHSQVYPLLAELEEQGYAQFEHVPQSDKPDKKIYTITSAGRDILRQWVAEPTSPRVIRDEFALKVFCVWLADKDAALSLLTEQIASIEEKLVRLHKRIEDLKGYRAPGTDKYDLSSPWFGPQLLIEKSIASKEVDLAWCHRVMDIILCQEARSESWNNL